MANFQIGHSALFPDGAELFANGKSGDEKLVLHAGKNISSNWPEWPIRPVHLS